MEGNQQVIKVFIPENGAIVIVPDEETAIEMQERVLESKHIAWILYIN